MRDLIYLDYNATTPVEKEVVDKMIPYFLSEYGNPANTTHRLGWAADEAANIAREQLASLIGASPEEIIFTGGATEAVNQAIIGVARTHASKGKHIVTCATEHKAVLESCRSLQLEGFEITELPVNDLGRLVPETVRAALRGDTILVSLMWANNETGVLHAIDDIKQILSDHTALFLTDATQALGKVPVDVEGIDLLACSAHKFYGPKGVGALYVRERRPPIRLASIIHGGAQESGLRAGTLNIPGIVGLGAAAELAEKHQKSDRQRLSTLRDRFEKTLLDHIEGVVVNGAASDRLPQTSNITFPGVAAADMMSTIGRLAVSMGSACSSESGKPSHVLTAMGLSREEAKGTVRFSLGRHTTEEEISEASELISKFFQSK